MATVHKEYDGCLISAKHLGLSGEAWCVYAGWDDQYICMVKGTWPNGAQVDGQLCRESAHVIERYLILGEDGKPVKRQ